MQGRSPHAPGKIQKCLRPTRHSPKGGAPEARKQNSKQVNELNKKPNFEITKSICKIKKKFPFLQRVEAAGGDNLQYDIYNKDERNLTYEDQTACDSLSIKLIHLDCLWEVRVMPSPKVSYDGKIIFSWFWEYVAISAR